MVDTSKKKDIDFVKQGKRNRLAGGIFELKVREDLEEKGWIVTKWMNSVDFERDRVAPAKRKYNPFSKVMTIGTGFPDLLCFKKSKDKYEVIGVEVKTNGSLTKFEKGQCVWYLEKGIMPRILIARKKKDPKDGRRFIIHYEDFREKYLDKGKFDVKTFEAKE